ncbi:unnamed protein product [Paramecium pentaurelia]|uniref:Glycoside hydrolase family 20 catalytic domain-containing protein n=1 Tax=Paramecium pentaurelia TaxID=43138 RepID=A0A8S1SXN0_9CILI|nr:unnamed protein product [Paramecium pentaurelia]
MICLLKYNLFILVVMKLVFNVLNKNHPLKNLWINMEQLTILIFKKRQKDIWNNQIKSQKKIIYWYNKKDQLPADQDDIIQWWGLSSQLNEVKNRPNSFILSDFHPLYLDIGVGNAFGDRYDKYQAWKDVYKWNPKIPHNFQGNILGGETLLWGETNNQNTHFQKLFLRSSILSDTLWNPEIKKQEQFWKFTQRLSDMEDRMNKYGFPVSPFTHSYCKRQLQQCFPQLYSTKLELLFMFIIVYLI